MRLIDANVLHSKLFEIGCHKSKLHPMDVMKMIEEAPTAYDINKVVEELESDSSVKLYGSRNSGNYMIPVDRAIEIAKQGGVSDDVCIWLYDSSYPYYKVGCENSALPIKYGDYCPYCGEKIKIVGD